MVEQLQRQSALSEYHGNPSERGHCTGGRRRFAALMGPRELLRSLQTCLCWQDLDGRRPGGVASLGAPVWPEAAVFHARPAINDSQVLARKL